MGSTMKGERGMKRHDDQERLYETRRHLVIALDYDRRTWIWDLPPSRSEPTHEELTHIVPAHVLAEADRLGLNVWRGRYLAVQAGWMTRTGRVTPEGKRLCIEQGWRDEEGLAERTSDLLEVGMDIPDTGKFTAPGGTARGMVPLFRQSASDPDVELPRTRPHAVSDVQALCFRQNGQVFVRSPIQARRNTR